MIRPRFMFVPFVILAEALFSDEFSSSMLLLSEVIDVVTAEYNIDKSFLIESEFSAKLFSMVSKV